MLRLRIKVGVAECRASVILIFGIAIDRVHRIGQEKTVHVKQFIVSDHCHLLRIVNAHMNW